MNPTKKHELIHFEQLKYVLRKEVESSLKIHKEFKDWSGNDIQSFQIDLEEKCKSTVSEKWVYLHFKNKSEKLPRIDVLNLLSQYCGFKNWDDFKLQNEAPKQPQQTSRIKLVYWMIGLTLLLGFGIYALWPGKQQLVIIFKDAYTLNTIDTKELRVNLSKTKVHKKDFSIVVNLNSPDTLKVNGPYYKKLESPLNFNESRDTLILKLFPDDYAMMLNFFSRTEHNDWDKRKSQLEEAIHDEAVIFQSHPEHNGIEILNKNEFIDRLILPVNSLKNLEIQDIVYQDGQIINLRFVQKEN